MSYSISTASIRGYWNETLQVIWKDSFRMHTGCDAERAPENRGADVSSDER